MENAEMNMNTENTEVEVDTPAVEETVVENTDQEVVGEGIPVDEVKNDELDESTNTDECSVENTDQEVVEGEVEESKENTGFDPSAMEAMFKGLAGMSNNNNEEKKENTNYVPTNVFENHQIDDKFIETRRCTICGETKKRMVDMIAVKKTGMFSKTKVRKKIGRITVCQNCGHFDIYTHNPIDVLLYLRGDGHLCDFTEGNVQLVEANKSATQAPTTQQTAAKPVEEKTNTEETKVEEVKEETSSNKTVEEKTEE